MGRRPQQVLDCQVLHWAWCHHWQWHQQMLCWKSRLPLLLRSPNDCQFYLYCQWSSLLSLISEAPLQERISICSFVDHNVQGQNYNLIYVIFLKITITEFALRLVFIISVQLIAAQIINVIILVKESLQKRIKKIHMWIIWQGKIVVNLGC